MMKRILTLCTLLVLLLGQLSATVITGRVVDLTGQPMTSNRRVVFILQNCGSNVPRISGASVIVPADKTVTPNAAGYLTGTIVGNDIVECGTVIGQTYYLVQIWNGSQKVYEKNYSITGATWNIATAVPLSNDPTAFLTYNGWLLGDLPYGSGPNTVSLLRGNKSTKRKVLVQEGDGDNSGPMFWADLRADDMPPSGVFQMPTLSGDLSNSLGSTNIAVTKVGGVTATEIADHVSQATNATEANVPSSLVKRNASGNFAAGTITANQFIGNLQGNVTGSAASFTGNLTGDVTSNGMATVLAAIPGLSAGTYGSGTVVPQITLDAKGRVVAVNPINIPNSLPSFTGNQDKVLSNNGSATDWRAFGGDVTGAPNSITVTKVQNRPFSAAAPQTGDCLVWSGTAYAPSNLCTSPGGSNPIGTAGGALAGNYPNPTLQNMTAAGAVAFVSGSSGILTIDSSNLFWDNTAKRLGIAASSPSYTLDVGGSIRSSGGYVFPDGSSQSTAFNLAGDLSGNASNQTVIRLRGRAISTTAPTDKQVLFWNNGAGEWQAGTVAVSMIPTGIPAASIGAGSVDNAKFGYLSGVTSDIQTQLGGKSATSHSHTLAGDVTGDIASTVVGKIQGRTVYNASAPTDKQVMKWISGNSRWEYTSLAFTDLSGVATTAQLPSGIDPTKLSPGTVDSTHLGYLAGVTSDLQAQLNAKSATTHSHTAGGDVTGDLASLTVTRIQNRDFYGGTPNDGQVWGWVQANNRWEPRDVTAGAVSLSGDVSGASDAVVVVGLQGRNISNAPPGNLQYLGWNSSTLKWEPKTLPASGVSTVFGRAGAVVAANNDYSFAQISGTVGTGQLPSGIPVVNIGAGTVDNTKFGYLSAVTSDIQAQINGKAGTSHTHVPTDLTSAVPVTLGGTGLTTIASGKLLYASAANTLAALTLGTSLGITAGTMDVVANTTNQRVGVLKAASLIGTRKAINFIEGSNVTLTIADDSVNDRVNLTINSAQPATFVRTFNTRSGDVTPATNDYSFAQISGSVDVFTQVPAMTGEITGKLNNTVVAKVGGKTIYTSGVTWQDGMTWVYDLTNDRFRPQMPSSAPVSSVFGRTGPVVQQNGDYSFAQISGALDIVGQLPAGIDPAKLGTGTVTSAAFATLAGITTGVSIQSQLDAKAAASHNHDANAITTGTLGITHGGLGLTTVGSGKMLYASAANTLAELSVGGGLGISGGTISVTDGATVQKIGVRFNSGASLAGTRKEINFIPGVNGYLTIATVDNSANDRMDVTLTANPPVTSVFGKTGAIVVADLGTLPAGQLPTSGVTAQTYGSGSAVPVLTVDTYGRITSASTAALVLPTALNPQTIRLTDTSEDKISVQGNLGLTSTYGLGYETNALYFKSGSVYRWYIGQLANGGASKAMELGASGLTVTGSVTATSFAGNASSATALAATSGCTNQFARGIQTNGTANCNSVSATDMTAGDYSAKINSGTYSIAISGQAGSVTNGVYINTANTLTAVANSTVPLSIKPIPTTGTGHLLDLYNNASTPAITSYFGVDGILHGSGAGLASATVPIAALVAGDYSGKITSGTYSISINGSAASATTASTATALGADPANCSTTGQFPSGVDASGVAQNCNFPDWTYVTNKPVRQLNFSYVDPNIALGWTTIPSVWKAEAATTFTSFSCESDTGDAVINFQKDDGTPANILTGNLTCGTSFTAGTLSSTEKIFASGDRLDFQIVGGTAKRISISGTY